MGKKRKRFMPQPAGLGQKPPTSTLPVPFDRFRDQSVKIVERLLDYNLARSKFRDLHLTAYEDLLNERQNLEQTVYNVLCGR